MLSVGFCAEIQKVDMSGSQIQQPEKDREYESDSDDDDDLSSDSDDSDSFVHIPMPKCYQYNVAPGNFHIFVQIVKYYQTLFNLGAFLSFIF